MWHLVILWWKLIRDVWIMMLPVCKILPVGWLFFTYPAICDFNFYSVNVQVHDILGNYLLFLVLLEMTACGSGMYSY